VAKKDVKTARAREDFVVYAIIAGPIFLVTVGIIVGITVLGAR
jgi:hypothetical protein